MRKSDKRDWLSIGITAAVIILGFIAYLLR